VISGVGRDVVVVGAAAGEDELEQADASRESTPSAHKMRTPARNRLEKERSRAEKEWKGESEWKGIITWFREEVGSNCHTRRR
jgi:hypothetical protein